MTTVTVITGASGALGSAVSTHLVSLGHRVALVDMPGSGERLRTLAATIGPAASGFEVDATSEAAWKTAREGIEQSLGPITNAVLIAGAWQGGTPLHAADDTKVWRAMMNSNLETAHASLRALLPGMVERRAGSVVLIGSQAVERPWTSAGASAYAASKAAVVALMKVVSQEVLEHQVRVNAVLPSTLDTPANRRAMPTADTSAWVTTQSAAEVIAFLLSSASRDVTGAALPLYGRVR